MEVLPEGILGSSGLAVNEVQSLEISEDGEITQVILNLFVYTFFFTKFF